MPSMTEEMGRIASGIAACRQQRAQQERKRRAAAAERHKETGAMLHQVTLARQAMGHDQRKELAAAYHHHRRGVAAMLHDLTAARAAMGRDLRRELAAGPPARRRELGTLMRQFDHQRQAWRRGYDQMIAAEHARTAAFMHELTAGVAAMRDGFAAAQQARGAARLDSMREMHDQLASFAGDRIGAGAAWRGETAHRYGQHHARRPSSRAEGAQ